jgi:SPP1 gp7 family putative phage head morphogenesis protein
MTKEVSIPVTRPNKKIEKKFREELIKLFKKEIYQPIAKLLKDQNIKVKLNSVNQLKNSILKGKIVYREGILSGEMTLKEINAVRSFGFKYDKRLKGFRIPNLERLPIDVQQAVGTAVTTNIRAGENLINALDNLDSVLDQNLLTFEKKAEKIYEQIISDVTKRADKSLKKKVPTIDLSPKISRSKFFAENFTNNLNLPIKNFSQKEVSVLRKFMKEQVAKGFRASDAEKFIVKRFGVAKNKAKFLAKQETSLATTAIREERYRDAGAKRYVWQTSNNSRVREDHKDLNDKVFFFDDPPVVNRATGKRANPGQDYGCMCVAKPIIEVTT